MIKDFARLFPVLMCWAKLCLMDRVQRKHMSDGDVLVMEERGLFYGFVITQMSKRACIHTPTFLYKVSLLIAVCTFVVLPVLGRLFLCLGINYNLFYFFYFFSKPLKFPFGIHFFSNVRNLMSNHILDSILVNTVFLSHCDKVFSSIMRSMIRI